MSVSGSQVNSSQRHKAESSKADPTALWIGFDDETKLKDPFKDKPALKTRQHNDSSKAQSSAMSTNRSKSAKDTFSIMSSRLVKRTILKAKQEKVQEKPPTVVLQNTRRESPIKAHHFQKNEEP